MAASSMIGNLAVSLTMNTAAFQQGATIAERRANQLQGRMAAVGSSLKGIGASLGAGIAISGLASLASNAFEMASSLSEASEKAGVTVEQLQRLRFAAEQTGVGTEKMDAALAKLTRGMGELRNGAPAAVKAFAAIGLSARDIQGMNTGEVFRLVAEKLSQIPDPAVRAAAAVAIYGKQGQALIPIVNGGAAAIDNFAEASKKNGEISTADAAKLDELGDSWGKFKTKLGVVTANIIARLAEGVEGFDSFLRGVQKWADDSDAAIAAFATSAVNAIGNMVRSIGQWISEKLGVIWRGLIDKINKVKGAFDSLGGVIGVSYEGAGATFQKASFTMMSDAEQTAGSVSTSFADMADKVLGSIGRLSQSVKGGGFLDILSSVIGLGLQLGGAGVFGKGVATNINNPGGGGFVKPSSSPRGPSIEVLPSPYFNVVVDGRAGGVVQRAAPVIAAGGSADARSREAFMRNRTLA